MKDGTIVLFQIAPSPMNMKLNGGVNAKASMLLPVITTITIKLIKKLKK